MRKSSAVRGRARDKVVVSAGYGQFYLGRLAVRLSEAKQLTGYLIMAYPKGLTLLLKPLSRLAPIRRFLERNLAIPNQLVKSFPQGEISVQLAQRAWVRGDVESANHHYARAFDTYAAWAGRALARLDAHIYHYRAGLGGASVIRAKRRGMILLCDLSVAHPDRMAKLIGSDQERDLGPKAMWRRVSDDVAAADYVLVNSEFVRSTCIDAGISGERIRVAYTALEPGSISIMADVANPSRFDDVQVMFAGTAEIRKGIDIVVASAAQPSMQSLHWQIIGTWAAQLEELRDGVTPNVELVAHLSRTELTRRISSTAVFVFPSRAEGSARVVAEALGAGCFVITTPQAGSITRDGIDGRIIPPNDREAVVAAVEEYLQETPAERRTRSVATAEYARAMLSENTYVGTVQEIYEEIALAHPRQSEATESMG